MLIVYQFLHDSVSQKNENSLDMLHMEAIKTENASTWTNHSCFIYSSVHINILEAESQGLSAEHCHHIEPLLSNESTNCTLEAFKPIRVGNTWNKIGRLLCLGSSQLWFSILVWSAVKSSFHCSSSLSMPKLFEKINITTVQPLDCIYFRASCPRHKAYISKPSNNN